MIRGMVLAAYLLALASILATHVLKAFTVAEVLAVLAFGCGLMVFWLQRRQVDGAMIGWGQRLIVIGSITGLIGIPLKLLLVLFGIGAAEHDSANHAAAAVNPILIHIHHLFFNLGFLILLISLLVIGVGHLRSEKS